MPICPKCRTGNHPKDQFCQGCGNHLDPGQDGIELVDTGIVCPGCDTFNEPNQKECTKCGQFLGGLTEILTAMSGQAGSNPPSSTKLVLIRGHGEPDSVFLLQDASTTIGRQASTITIQRDPYLSPLHAVIERKENNLFIQDQGSLNGTFIRIRQSIDLEPQTEIILGGRRILLVGAGGAAFDSRIKVKTDQARIYGSPVTKHSYLALRELYTDKYGKAMAGSVILRTGPVISIGGRNCDVSFPSDPAISARYLELHIQGTKIKAVTSSENAKVFYRIKKPTPLHDGDEVLIGEELLRLESD